MVSRFTVGELMVVAAAREIRDHEVVFVGMRLPLIAFVAAKKTHAPHAIGLFENGVIRSVPSPELIYTMADPPNIYRATQCLDMLGVMSLLQSGRVHLGFLGAAEVDRFGNLNSTQVRSKPLRSKPMTPGAGADQESGGAKGNSPAPMSSMDGFTRLPGSGGACDIASLAHRFVVMVEHSPHRLPERVGYMTSPGNGDGNSSGKSWRKKAGLPRGGPSAVITTKAVLRFGEDGAAYLASHHPGSTVAEIVASTGWKLEVSDKLSVTREPTTEELSAIRDYDPSGFWTGRAA